MVGGRITSESGRGVVVIEGEARMRATVVESCAATGVYVGNSRGDERGAVAIVR